MFFLHASTLQKGQKTKDKLNFKQFELAVESHANPARAGNRVTADVPSKHYSKAQPTHNAQGNWEPMLL